MASSEPPVNDQRDVTLDDTAVRVNKANPAIEGWNHMRDGVIFVEVRGDRVMLSDNLFHIRPGDVLKNPQHRRKLS
jgi:hypothetical protein